MSISFQNELTITFDGVHLINADRFAVWEAMQSPANLKQCLPGCDAISGSPQRGFKARLTQQYGQLSVSFSGEATIDEIEPQSTYSIRSSGHGGLAGYAQSIAKIRLEDVEGGTELSYRGHTILGGFQSEANIPMAQKLARKFADQFFEALQYKIEAQPN